MHCTVQDAGLKEESYGKIFYPGLFFFKRKNNNNTKQKENLNIIMKKHVIKS